MRLNFTAPFFAYTTVKIFYRLKITSKEKQREKKQLNEKCNRKATKDCISQIHNMFCINFLDCDFSIGIFFFVFVLFIRRNFFPFPLNHLYGQNILKKYVRHSHRFMNKLTKELRLWHTIPTVIYRS